MRITLLFATPALVLFSQEPRASRSAEAPQQVIQDWSVSLRPLLALEDDGRPGTEFLRIVGAWRISGNRIAVLNHSSQEIRIFNDHGELVKTFGRRGGGPSEFEFPVRSDHSGDTAFVYDAMLKRESTILLGEEPRLLGSVIVGARGDRDYSVRGRLTDGRWIVLGSSSGPDWEARTGIYRDEAAVGIVEATRSGNVRWVGEGLGTTALMYHGSDNLRDSRVGPIPFSAWFLAAATGTVIWYGSSGAGHLTRYDVVTGRPRRIALPLEAAIPSEALIAAKRRERALVERPGDRAYADAIFSREFLPARLPFFEALLVGVNGEVWVQEYAGLYSAPTRYLVLDSNGVPIARVATPAGFRVTDVESAHVTGVHKDEDGVETVRVYQLTRR